jgi:hypothetical protein
MAYGVILKYLVVDKIAGVENPGLIPGTLSDCMIACKLEIFGAAPGMSGFGVDCHYDCGAF